MSITEILNTKDAKPVEQLTEIAAIVATARKAYGNTKEEIPAIEVNTVDGMMDFVYLTDETKVHLVRNEVQAIKVRALEYGKHVPGANVNKKLEELIATSPILTNLSTTVSFDYL